MGASFKYDICMCVPQSGTAYEDIVRSVAIGNDGSVFLTGDTGGNWATDNAGDLGSLDFVACMLDASGNEVWRWQVSLYTRGELLRSSRCNIWAGKLKRVPLWTILIITARPNVLWYAWV